MLTENTAGVFVPKSIKYEFEQTLLKKMPFIRAGDLFDPSVSSISELSIALAGMAQGHHLPRRVNVVEAGHSSPGIISPYQRNMLLTLDLGRPILDRSAAKRTMKKC